MTWKDPIVEEVRQAREAHAKKFNYDLWAIYEDLKKLEEECGLEVVSFPPKPARSIKLDRRLTHTEAAKSLTNAPYQIPNESLAPALREGDAEGWGEGGGQEEEQKDSWTLPPPSSARSTSATTKTTKSPSCGKPSSPTAPPKSSATTDVRAKFPAY